MAAIILTFVSQPPLITSLAPSSDVQSVATTCAFVMLPECPPASTCLAMCGETAFHTTTLPSLPAETTWLFAVAVIEVTPARPREVRSCSSSSSGTAAAAVPAACGGKSKTLLFCAPVATEPFGKNAHARTSALSFEHSAYESSELGTSGHNTPVYKYIIKKNTCLCKASK